MTSARKTSSQNPSESFIRVKHSKVHGQGVFATRKIPAGTEIIEYQGKRITEKQADKRFGLDPDNPHHTFFFSLDSGKLIDGGDQGNDARWINHACDPNCEAKEEKGRVFIHALRDIGPPKNTGSTTALDGPWSGNRLERLRRVGRLTMTPMKRPPSMAVAMITDWR